MSEAASPVHRRPHLLPSRLRHIVVAQAHGPNFVRLAKLRKPVGFFDTSKLSKDGYLVRVEDQDPKQPAGEEASSAMAHTSAPRLTVLMLSRSRTSPLPPTLMASLTSSTSSRAPTSSSLNTSTSLLREAQGRARQGLEREQGEWHQLFCSPVSASCQRGTSRTRPSESYESYVKEGMSSPSTIQRI